MPQDGLIPNHDWKILRVSSESRFNGRQAKSAIDGDPRTLCHSQWQEDLGRHPHELLIDLGEEREIRGFRYLARQDSGWNGALEECEFYVAARSTDFGKTATKAVHPVEAYKGWRKNGHAGLL